MATLRFLVKEYDEMETCKSYEVVTINTVYLTLERLPSLSYVLAYVVRVPESKALFDMGVRSPPQNRVYWG